jgi:L-2-hydroxycarboxylate dehydrogenase (NAD+)
MTEHVVTEKDLHSFCADCLGKVQVSRRDSKLIADHLVSANLRGVDSHGVIRIPFYVEGIRKGSVKPRADIRIVKETPISVLLDGGQQSGIVVANHATRLAVKKAAQTGIGVVGIISISHVGMLAYYTERIARRKLIGFVCVNASAHVAPWGGADKVLGTNPMSYAFPTRHTPIIFDGATSAAASFKIRIMELRKQEIPSDWALDRDGNPTRNAAEALAGALLPFGQHKGYAFSLLVELLTSPLLGGLPSKDVQAHPSTQGSMFMMAINPTLFRKFTEYCDSVQEVVRIIKSARPAKGFTEILLPGDVENRTMEERLRAGIPIDEETWRELERVANDLGIKLPPCKP